MTFAVVFFHHHEQLLPIQLDDIILTEIQNLHQRFDLFDGRHKRSVFQPTDHLIIDTGELPHLAAIYLVLSFSA